MYYLRFLNYLLIPKNNSIGHCVRGDNCGFAHGKGDLREYRGGKDKGGFGGKGKKGDNKGFGGGGKSSYGGGMGDMGQMGQMGMPHMGGQDHMAQMGPMGGQMGGQMAGQMGGQEQHPSMGMPEQHLGAPVHGGGHGEEGASNSHHGASGHGEHHSEAHHADDGAQSGIGPPAGVMASGHESNGY